MIDHSSANHTTLSISTSLSPQLYAKSWHTPSFTMLLACFLEELWPIATSKKNYLLNAPGHPMSECSKQIQAIHRAM
uniref:Uncharacterized protein n=1 Tax=Manihot esculenta TaxID=3983 RepID=A0A2C9UCZ7_MANES